ncbi:uncharacterized protein LOC107399785 isoform X1 [Peromyscus maniculatus bairdii]|uniref:uncharacterized protein LOC107399785 isoform X1 n=1 Tax=Peromyscus maniculatus bairdii TaxID=230844 RepID=UPI003FD42AE7
MLFERQFDVGVLSALERTRLFVRRSRVQMNHDFGTLPNSSRLFLNKHTLGQRNGHAALIVFLVSPNQPVRTKKKSPSIKLYLLLVVVDAHPTLLDHQYLIDLQEAAGPHKVVHGRGPGKPLPFAGWDWGPKDSERTVRRICSFINRIIRRAPDYVHLDTPAPNTGHLFGQTLMDICEDGEELPAPIMAECTFSEMLGIKSFRFHSISYFRCEMPNQPMQARSPDF